jgi:hypothetical protein
MFGAALPAQSINDVILVMHCEFTVFSAGKDDGFSLVKLCSVVVASRDIKDAWDTARRP